MKSDEINILDLLKVLLRDWWKIVIFALVFTIGINIGLRFVEKKYKAEATVIPLDQAASGGGGLSALLGGLSGAIGGGSTGNVPYIQAVLGSYNFAKYVVEKRDLVKVYYSQFWNEKTKSWQMPEGANPPTSGSAAGMLKGSILTDFDVPTNLFTIKFIHNDPVWAYKICAFIIEDLPLFISELEEGQTEHKISFIEKQLMSNQRDLLEAGKELANYYQNQGISATSSKLNVLIQSNISTAKVQTDTDSLSEDEMIQMAEELRSRIANLESDFEESKNLYVKDVPQQVYLQYLTMKKEILAQLASLLANQYEMSKINGQEEALMFQLLDEPRLDMDVFKPNITLLTILAFIGSTFLGLIFVFGIEFAKRIRKLLKEDSMRSQVKDIAA